MTELSCIKKTSVRFLGLRNYQEIADLQTSVSGQLRATQNIEIWGIEFQPIITLGIRGEAGDVTSLQNQIPVVRTDRGGQATLHNPGQLVIYPMLDLKAHGVGVRDFVCMLIRATSAVLKTFGIDSHSKGAPGVYTSQGKIAFIGIRLDRGVVRHGISINIMNELAPFNCIKSCGVSAAAMDKVQNHTNEALDVESFFDRWVIAFENEFKLVRLN